MCATVVDAPSSGNFVLWNNDYYRQGQVASLQMTKAKLFYDEAVQYITNWRSFELSYQNLDMKYWFVFYLQLLSLYL